LISKAKPQKGTQDPNPKTGKSFDAGARENVDEELAKRRNTSALSVLYPYLVEKLLDIAPYDFRDSARQIGTALARELESPNGLDAGKIIAAVESWAAVGKPDLKIPLQGFISGVVRR